MSRILADITDDVTETVTLDETDFTVAVRRSQDVEPIMDRVAAMNASGLNDVEGLGRPQFEVPITVAIEFCERRGIPWEKFLYTNEYDSEWLRFGQEYSRLAYRPAKRQFAVSG